MAPNENGLDACLVCLELATANRLRSDYDVSRAPASIRREQKMNMLILRRSRIVVVS